MTNDTNNDFEASWNEGEDNSHEGDTARALIAKRKADEAVTRDVFVSSFKTQTADPLDSAESGPKTMPENVTNTAVDDVLDPPDKGVPTEIEKAAP
jgi:hypothetical protein